jgi:hypothetical protein
MLINFVIIETYELQPTYPKENRVTKKEDFDQAAAHKYFSAKCFNQAWELIDKEQRTPQEDEQMIRLSLASQYHWSQRLDHSNTSASIGYWQTARIYALLKQGENAARYGQLCLEESQAEGVSPFYLGYAYEALARAAAVVHDETGMNKYLKLAGETAERVSKADERKMLLDDLDTILLS